MVMSPRAFLPLLFVLTTSAGLLPQTSQAEAPPPDRVIDVPPVVIHGTRRAEDFAAPSVVIERNQMTDAATDLPEVLDQQPGLRTSRMGGLGSFSMLSIRGSTGDQVLVFLDGIPLNSAEGGPVDVGALPLGPVQSVVVYRGMSPVMFGGSAIGGVVDVRTREVGEPLLELEAAGGSFGTRGARGFFGWGGRVWGVGLSLDYLGSAGDFSFTNDNGTAFTTADDREVERRNNRFDQVVAMAKGHVDLAPDLRLSALNLLSWRQRGLPGIALYETEQAALEGLRNLSGLNLTLRRLWTSSGRLSITPYVSYSTTALSDPLDEIGLLGADTDDVSLVPGIAVVLGVPISLGEEASFVLAPTVQLEYRYEHFEPGAKKDEQVSGGGGGSLRHFWTGAAEVAFAADPVDIELIASARVEHLRSDLSGSPRFGLDDDQAGAASHTALTYRFALVQSSIPHTDVKLNYSHSVRFPSLFELFGDTGYVLGNASLKPEHAHSFDVGVLHHAGWLGGPNLWTLEVFGFVTWTEDLIQLIQNSQNVTTSENVDAARVFGVEVGTYLDVVRHLRVRGSLTWLHTEDTSRIAARKGKRLPFRPEWKVYTRLEGYHRFENPWLTEIGVSTELEWLAGNFLDFANLVEIPSRALLGFGVYARGLTDQLRLDVSIRNALGHSVQDFAGFPLPGASVMASLRWTPDLRPALADESEEPAPPPHLEETPTAPRTPPR